MHYLELDDEHGDLVELVAFCSDSCHQDYCQQTDATYDGWNGAHEGSDSVEFCALCGVVAGGLGMAECQLANVVVNRLLSEHGERCTSSGRIDHNAMVGGLNEDEHEDAHWIQLPASYLEPTERTELVLGHDSASRRVTELISKGWRVAFVRDADNEPEFGTRLGLYRLTISEPMRGRQTTTKGLNK